MIDVERIESAARPGDVDALFQVLEREPGLWMGCDVESGVQFRKESKACADPALRFCLDGRELLVTPMGRFGTGLLSALLPLGSFRECEGGAIAPMPNGQAVVDLLRSFLALFHPCSAELALFGVFSFDYHLLGSVEPLPDDGRRRLVLYFPERVLAIPAGGAPAWVEFRFGCEVAAPDAERPTIANVRLKAGQDELQPGGHASRVARGVELLQRGELYSLVLSQVFRRKAHVRASEAFGVLRRRNPYPAMFYCNLGGGELLFGASPDLQVRAGPELVESSPVCGTFRRGADAVDDAAQALELFSSAKEAAALALCADSAAEELATVCEPGSVEIRSRRRLHFFSTIIHTIDHLSGRRRKDADAFDIMLAHATPATVAGLPKGRALAAIESLEQEWRGWYAGAVARLGTDGSVDAYTVLRAARIADGIAEVRTGGNILVDSVPEKEEEESWLKAQTLFRVLGGEPVRPDAVNVNEVRWRLNVLPDGDSFRNRLVNALAQAGGRESDQATIAILCMPAPANGVGESPLLAIGEGAVWLLRREGVVPEALPVPEYGRPVEGRGLPGTFLGGVPVIYAGWYMREGFRTGSLPEEWIEAAVSNDGWVLAAQRRDGRACAILFRPDSVLSSRAATGVNALRAAFEWLDPYGMFAEEPTKEEK